MGATTQDTARTIEDAASYFDVVVFGLLFVLGLVGWLRRRDTSRAWFTLTFATITFTLGIGIVLGDNPESPWDRLSIAALALMPFCLYRFMRTFARSSGVVDSITSLLTVAMVAWSLAIDLPPEGTAWTTGVLLYVIAFLVHWTLLSIATAGFFLREARGSSGIARRRMNLFATATIVLTTALLLAAFAGDGSSDRLYLVSIVIQLAAAMSAALFLIALAPPRFLRASWRAHELDSMQGGLRWIVQGETVADVRERALRAATLLTGASGAVLVDDERAPIAWNGMALVDASRIAEEARARDHEHDDHAIIVVDRIIVVCGPAAPFFSDTERQLLDNISAFTQLAEDRARTLEIERESNERLRQVDQLKTEFVAMVAHDLRSPMSVISGFADTIHDRWDVLPDEQKLEYLRLISRNTRSLAEFVEDVLQVARMESGELHYDMQAFDARLVVQRIVMDMQVAHPELTLTVDAPEQLPDVLGDMDRNWQILTNLVSNAMKFSDGDPRIEVELSTLVAEGKLAIAVRDNGVGIADEDLPRLFRRFSRVGPTRRTVAGTGLGLYIVKSMVEAQGGSIWVDSQPGQGSTFTYTLPIATEETAA
ncbi:MAG: two-component sensor histidine kinase [Thermoleophilia bacterium]|nr:two-component sensor histidine kinase [Thermoleophilia bacterium]